MDYSLRMNYSGEIDRIIQDVDRVEQQSYTCYCGTYVKTRTTHCRLLCLTVESERRISMAYMQACNTYGGCGHDWATRERGIALFKADAQAIHMPEIQCECFKELKYFKKILVDNDVFTEFIEKYPKYTKLFDMKTKEELSFEDAIGIRGGTIRSDICTFFNFDFIQEILRKRYKEYQEQQLIFKKAQEKENEKCNEEFLKKEYECMKLFNRIEASKMNSYELYQEYTKIKTLRDKYSEYETIKFHNYFTEPKIAEIQKELNKNGIK